MTSVTLSLSKTFRYVCLISLAIGCLAAYAGLTSSAKNSVIKVAAPPALVQTNEILRLQFENSPNSDDGEAPTTADLNGSNPKNLPYPTGIRNQGVYLGRNERLFYASNGNITDLEGSIELWINPIWDGTDTTTRNILRYGATSGILLYKEGTNLKISLNRNSADGSNELDVQSGIESWRMGEWHHVAATWSNTGKFIRLYIDGSLASDRNITGSLPIINQVTNNRFQLGADGIRFPLEAVVDEVKISDNPRTSQEIATRMVSDITVSNALTFTPLPASIDLYPGWSYWKDLRFNFNHSTLGPLTLPVLAATWSTETGNIAEIEMDATTGRIKAKNTSPEGAATIKTAYNGLSISITTNVHRATKDSDDTESFSEAPASTSVYKIPVAIVRYLPSTDSTNLDSSITGRNTPLETVKVELRGVEKNLKFLMETGSRFRGYNTGNPSTTPTPSLGYQVVKIINIYEPIPNGIKGTMPGTYYPDYKQILGRINAASLVNTDSVKEIWIESYSYNSTAFEQPLVEAANMSSQLTGDVTNNSRRNDDLPIYDKSYTVYGIDLDKPFKVAARAHASQLEALFTYANKNHDGDTTMFARSFVGLDANGLVLPNPGALLPNTTNMYGRVGKATRPPNTAIELNPDNSNAPAVFNNATLVESDIKDWNAIDPPLTNTTQQINSAAWRDLTLTWPVAPLDTATKAETQWYVYWMQSIPGLSNAVFHENAELMNNWWRIVGDWDGAKASKLGLYTPATCNYTLGASAQTVVVTGGSGSVSVTATTGCSWTVTNDPVVNWITITSAVNNTGNGTVNFTVATNPGSPRTATLKIAGLTHTITQEGNNPIPALSNIEPPTVTAGSPAFTLTLNGTGFVATSTVQGRTTTFVSSTKLTVEITAVEIASAGEISNIRVISPAPGGGTSLETKTLTINNPAPTLSSIAPVIAGSPGFTLTLNGTGFVAASTVLVNNVSRSKTLINSTPPTLTIAMTTTEIASAGEINIVVVNPTPGGGSSAPQKLFINNPVPTLTQPLNPPSALAGSTDLTLTVTGTNFNSTSKVRWNGVDRTTTLASGSTTQLSATIPATDLVNAGTSSVTVFNPTPGGGPSNALVFTINNPQLTLTSLAPSSIVAGNSTFTLTVNGTGFLANSVVQWNGNNRTTTFGSSTQLSTSITAAEVATGGSANVTVFNPEPSGGTSSPITFSINNPVPTLTSLNQTSALAGSAGFTLTIIGTNFNSASKVRWNGTDRATTLASGSTTQLSATIPATDLVNAGTSSVTVFNPTPGGGASVSAITFTINNLNPVPTLTNLAPNTSVAGGNAFTLIVTGTNFLANSVVRWNGADRPTTLVNGSSTQLSASITADDIKTGGSANVTVFNPAPGGGASGIATFSITSLCSYSISPTTQNFTSAGGDGSVNIMTTTSCTWTVTSNASWITINASSGSTIANYTVAANTGANRSGTMTVAGQTFTVTQDAPQTTCTYTLSPVSQNFAASGGNGTFIVATGTGCTWAATSNDNWITTSVTGTGVSYSVQANTGAARTGTMMVAGQTFTVTQDALQVTCASQRTLPAEYIAGFASRISLQITPPAATTSYAIEETPPTGWTVSAIENGSFDAVNNKVKWGPFFDSTARTLSYSVTPPAGTTGQKIFSGTVSFNGTNSTICGATTIVVASQIHPADLNNNLRIEINELTAYGTAWKAGTIWSRAPNPINFDYVTNAGLIWSKGEVYHYDASIPLPPFVAGASISMRQQYGVPSPSEQKMSSLMAQATPLKMRQASGYMPGLGFGIGSTFETLFAANPAAIMGGTAVGSFNAANYTPGTGITVTINVTPDASTIIYAVEDTVPTGWTVSGINNSGGFDSNNRKVKWGPYFDNSPRSLMYVITPPTGETGNKTFVGAVSFDGASVNVAGARILAPPPSCSYSLGTASQSLTAVGGVGNFAVITSAGCTWTAATSDAWISITQGTGNGNGAVNFSVIANTGAARSGTISVGGQTFMVNQTAGCTYSLNQLTQNFSATGGTGAFTLTTGAGCGWTAVPSAAWITITSTATGAGNSNISYAVAASDGTARNGSISVGGQVFSVTQAVNAVPAITAAAGISATQNLAANTVTIATVTDTETAAGALTVTALTIPTGITIGTITNTNGTISAPVSASCAATIGSNSITLKVTDSHGASVMTNLLINVVSNVDCNPATVDTSAGDHKPGSILIYNYYTSDVSQPSTKNTQIKLTNTSDTAEVTVRMSLIDGQTGNISIVFFCLLPNQTINFLASEYDPSVTGYIIAMAVDKTTGCPIKANVLMGGAYVKLPTGHVANLPAIAVSALATTPATCAAGSTTATINFDGAAYSRLPRLLAIDNLSSIKDGNNMMLVLNRIGGNLISSAPSIGAVSGKMYDTGRVAEDFNFTSSAPQSANTLSVNFPRIGPKKLDLFIPAGQSGWMKVGADSNIGLTGVLFNFSAVRSQYAYSGGNNLQAVVLAGNVTLDIPLAVPNCR